MSLTSERWFRTFKLLLGSSDGVNIESNTRDRTRSELSTGATPFFTRQIDSTMIVPTGGAPTPVDLGGITAGKALTFVYDKAISVSINGGPAIQLSVPSTGEGLFHVEGAISAVTLTNSGAANATVRYIVVGT